MRAVPRDPPERGGDSPPLTDAPHLTPRRLFRDVFALAPNFTRFGFGAIRGGMAQPSAIRSHGGQVAIVAQAMGRSATPARDIATAGSLARDLDDHPGLYTVWFVGWAVLLGGVLAWAKWLS